MSGTATFDSVPPSATVGLNYPGTTQRAIRGATVQLLDGNGQVLATTTTDAQGAYSFSMAAAQAIQVRVRAELKAANNQWDFTVRDNTQGDALYALDSGVFTPDAATVTRNVRAASGWGGSSYTGTRAAGPFALLDVAYQGRQKVLDVQSTTVLPPLKVFWSVNNRPTGSNPAIGEIGTSFYTRVNGEHRLYILGQQDVDTDEYDSHVVAHEFGHYLTSAVSRDDSIGGSHGQNDRLDMRVAFSEGYANAWSGMVLNNPRYSDSLGAAQGTGFAINVSTAPVGLDRGWYSETTVQYLMWTAHQQVGFGPFFSALQATRLSPALNSIYTFAPALPAGSVNLPAVQIFGTGPYGVGESNNGGDALNIPVYKTYTPGTTQTYCTRTSAGADGNKLGNTIFVRFNTSGPRVVTMVRNGATTVQTDPDFMLIQANGTRSDAASLVENSETLSVTLSAGEHVAALIDYQHAGGPRCFDFRVN